MMESTAFAAVSPTTTACLMGFQATTRGPFLRIEKETSGCSPMGASICFATRPSLVTRHGREFRTPISIRLWRYVTERYGSEPVTPLTFWENKTASPPFSIEECRAKGLGQCWKTTAAWFGLEWIWPSFGFRMAVFEKSGRLVGSVSRASAGCQVLPKIRAERFGFLVP